MSKNITKKTDEKDVSKKKSKVSLPNYFTDENKSPKLWLDCVASAYRLSNVSDSQEMCSGTLAMLPCEILRNIADKLEEITVNKDPYKKLIKTLLEINRPSRKELLDSILNENLLGDRKPSTMLKELKNKLESLQPGAASEGNNELLKELFFRTLPLDIRKLLTVRPSENLFEAARIADLIHSETGTEVYEIQRDKNTNTNRNNNSENQLVIALMAKLENLEANNLKLQQEVKELKGMEAARQSQKESWRTSNNKEFNEKRKTDNTSKTQGSMFKNGDNKETSVCFYHRTYGEKAFKCEEGCHYYKKNYSNSSGH